MPKTFAAGFTRRGSPPWLEHVFSGVKRIGVEGMLGGKQGRGCYKDRVLLQLLH